MADRVIFGKQAAERTKAAVIAVEKMVLGKDSRQSRRGVVGGAAIGGYFCQPSSTIAAATGTWPTITPGTGSYDIYQDQDGSLVKVDGSPYSVVNWYKASVAASKICKVTPNGYGGWDIEAQSCT